MPRRSEPPSSLLVSSTSAASSRSSSPPSPGWQQDPYAPRQPGLPLYTARKNLDHRPSSTTKDLDDGDMVELVDSSTARCRAGQSAASYADRDPSDDSTGELDSLIDGSKSKEHGDKEAWPVSGIGMEGRIPETRKEFLAKGGQDATSRRERQAVTWVRPPPFAARRRDEAVQSVLRSRSSVDCSCLTPCRSSVQADVVFSCCSVPSGARS